MDRRFNQRVLSAVSIRAQESGQVAKGKVIDLSVTGILVDLDRDVTHRDNLGFVEIEMDLPGNGSVRATARPIRSIGHHQALKFVHMSDMDRLALAEHIDAVVGAA